MSGLPDQQAMWEALGILGFDLDGDETPAAAIAGMSDGGFRAYFLFCAREQRRDYDAALDEIPLGGLAAERERIAHAIEASYLGPDFGRQYDGRESPQAALANSYDEGLEHAARIARNSS